MICKQVRAALSAYFDGELDAKPVSRTALAADSEKIDDRDAASAASDVPLTEQIRDHIASCQACTQELRLFEQLRQLVSVQPECQLPPPSWESIAMRLDTLSGMALAAGSDAAVSATQEPAAIAQPRTIHATNLRRTAFAGLLTLAASVLLFFSLRGSHPDGGDAVVQAGAATLNLRPLLELFKTDSARALKTLTDQHPTVDVSLAKAEAEFGRPTFIQSSAKSNTLPGNAQLVSTKLMQFPFCKCPAGECTCGPGGCNCVACFCERPDGSTYLVLEHCKSQSVTFGDLPVQLVKRGERHLQQVEVEGTTAISWEQNGERLTAIGLRGSQEIDTLLAQN